MKDVQLNALIIFLALLPKHTNEFKFNCLLRLPSARRATYFNSSCSALIHIISTGTRKPDVLSLILWPSWFQRETSRRFVHHRKSQPGKRETNYVTNEDDGFWKKFLDDTFDLGSNKPGWNKLSFEQ